MEKKGRNQIKSPAVSKILITQPKPESEKSPYFDLEKKYNLSITFQPFIRIEGVTSKEFRKQKIEIQTYSSYIFTSRHAIDHFFRLVDEMRITVSQESKYFCISESVALYLQKFILYRKRKVFFGVDGSNKRLVEVILKHKNNERFLFPCSDHADNEIVAMLRAEECVFDLPVMYKTVSNDIRKVVEQGNFDLICFFTSSGVKSLFENIPNYTQQNTLIGAFGAGTVKAVVEAGLQLSIKAPEPQIPSMAAAIALFLGSEKK
ncbi:MAG: uroporphyrinogen-III synthase [Bacteroidetes bacterium]|nr:uroporphyrinogen-III synthase [Bacteroidota bacterium]